MQVKVLERRRELGMTQEQVARAAGVGQHTVSDIERGLHVPRVDVAILISRALMRPVEDLFLVDADGAAHPI